MCWLIGRFFFMPLIGTTMVHYSSDDHDTAVTTVDDTATVQSAHPCTTPLSIALLQDASCHSRQRAHQQDTRHTAHHDIQQHLPHDPLVSSSSLCIPLFCSTDGYPLAQSIRQHIHAHCTTQQQKQQQQHHMATASSSSAPFMRIVHFVKSILLMHYGKQKCIMDLACGKGHDVYKLEFCRPRYVLFIDKDAMALEEARKRWKRCTRRYEALFIQADFLSSHFTEDVVRAMGYGSVISPCTAETITLLDPSLTPLQQYTMSSSNESVISHHPVSMTTMDAYCTATTLHHSPSTYQGQCAIHNVSTNSDVVDSNQIMQSPSTMLWWRKKWGCKHTVNLISCQFAMHHTAASIQDVDTFMRNVVPWLEPGGLFIGTLLDAEQVASKMMQEGVVKMDDASSPATEYTIKKSSDQVTTCGAPIGGKSCDDNRSNHVPINKRACGNHHGYAKDDASSVLLPDARHLDAHRVLILPDFTLVMNEEHVQDASHFSGVPYYYVMPHYAKVRSCFISLLTMQRRFILHLLLMCLACYPCQPSVLLKKKRRMTIHCMTHLCKRMMTYQR